MSHGPPNDPPAPRFGVRTARRVVVGIVGVTVLGVGVVLLALPGPGVVVIAAGLGILSIEFAFARQWLKYVQARAESAADKASIPKRWRWAFPVLALGVSAGAMCIPLFVGVVTTPRGLRWVHKPALTYRWTWVDEATLVRESDAGDPTAHAWLARLAAPSHANDSPVGTPSSAPDP
jgi:uncharacterized protein (TIGR02611 family)